MEEKPPTHAEEHALYVVSDSLAVQTSVVCKMVVNTLSALAS